MINFGSATGNLFNQLGSLGYLIAQMRAYQATQRLGMINTSNSVTAQFVNSPDIQAVMGGSYIGLVNSAGGIGSTLQTIAQQAINRAVFNDSPRLNQTLQQVVLNQSVGYVITQMQQANATILAATVSASAAGFVGVGNGVVTCSTKRPFDGQTLQNAFAEIVQVTCTADSYTGNAAVGNEGMTVTGTGSESDIFAFDWPLGSNGTAGITAINGNTDNGQGNTLTNSNFAAWTTELPNNWYPYVGGTNLHQETSITYDTNSCLRVTGDGTGTLTALQQQFGSNLTATNAAGTAATLSSQTQYSFNVFMRRDGTAGSGTLVVDLVDVNGVVINDQAGVANSISFNLATLTTNYASFSGVFRTPEALPTTIYIRYRLTVAYPNGQSFYIAKSSLGIMNQLYTSGPFFACHSGSVPFQNGDFQLTTITNSRGAGGTQNTFQTLLALLFYPNSYQSEYIFPSSATPSISDSLITAPV